MFVNKIISNDIKPYFLINNSMKTQLALTILKYKFQLGTYSKTA